MSAEHPDHDNAPAATQHKEHADMGKLYDHEIALPFNQDPQTWLEDHKEEWDGCFECSDEPVTEVTVLCIDERMQLEMKTQSGKRVLRMAGSGILWQKQHGLNDLVEHFVRYVESLRQGRPLNAIKVKIGAHGNGCGAGGVAFNKEGDTDQKTCDYLEKTLVPALQERGIKAAYIGKAPMRKDRPAHSALGAAVDCSNRLQRLPEGMNTFIISRLSVAQAIHDATLALEGVTLGGHGYGPGLLKQYTFVVVRDPQNDMDSQEIIHALEQLQQKYKGKVDVRIVTREAPKVAS
ncbi:MAG: hypothetical protein V1926_03955 [Candidatus Peregrinibacteria bacterium]